MTCTSYLRRSHPTALNSTQPPVSPLSSTSRWSPSTTTSPGRSQESLVPSSALQFALVRGRPLLDPTLAPTTAVSLLPPSVADDRERMLFPRRSHLKILSSNTRCIIHLCTPSPDTMYRYFPVAHSGLSRRLQGRTALLAEGQALRSGHCLSALVPWHLTTETQEPEGPEGAQNGSWPALAAGVTHLPPRTTWNGHFGLRTATHRRSPT